MFVKNFWLFLPNAKHSFILTQLLRIFRKNYSIENSGTKTSSGKKNIFENNINPKIRLYSDDINVEVEDFSINEQNKLFDNIAKHTAQKNNKLTEIKEKIPAPFSDFDSSYLPEINLVEIACEKTMVSSDSAKVLVNKAEKRRKIDKIPKPFSELGDNDFPEINILHSSCKKQTHLLDKAEKAFNDAPKKPVNPRKKIRAAKMESVVHPICEKSIDNVAIISWSPEVPYIQSDEENLEIKEVS